MKYYIAEDGQPAGPFEIKELLEHGLNPNSQVWNEKMTGWMRAAQVPELMALLQPAAPAQSPPSPYSPQQPAEPQPAAAEQLTMHDSYAPQQPQQQPQQDYGQQPSPYAQPQYEQPQQQQPTYQQQYQHPQYQQPYQQMPYGSPMQTQGFPPKNWMTESVILTVVSALCCCNIFSLITGIVAIVNAGKVNSLFRRGDTLGASEAADSAKVWVLITLGVLVVGSIIMGVWLMSTPEFVQAMREAGI